MKKLLTLLVLLPAAATAIDERQMNLQFSRTDQLIGRVQEDNDRLKGQVRQLERDNAEAKKAIGALRQELVRLSDEVLKMRNVEISNLQAGQKRLYDQIPVLNWGTETRSCAGIGDHQQIKLSQSPDGSHTLRYLCYDGRPLHLGTEVHTPPM